MVEIYIVIISKQCQQPLKITARSNFQHSAHSKSENEEYLRAFWMLTLFHTGSRRWATDCEWKCSGLFRPSQQSHEWSKRGSCVTQRAALSLSPTAASGTRTFPANLDELSVRLTSASALLWIASHALYYCCHICFDRGGWPDGQRNLWPAPNCRGVRWELAPRAAHIVSEHQTHTQHITNAKYCRVGGMSICCTYTNLKPNCPDNEHS